MSKSHPLKLKKFKDKKLSLKVNSSRHVQEMLQGFDLFMGLVIDECVDHNSGQVNSFGMMVIQGNSVIVLETLERIEIRLCSAEKSIISACPLFKWPVSPRGKNSSCEHLSY